MCDICDRNFVDKSRKVKSRYDDKTTKYKFCSEECERVFENTRMCKFCFYSGYLEYVNDGFMVCTFRSDTKYSCLDKYRIMKDRKLSLDTNLSDEDCDYIEEFGNVPNRLESNLDLGVEVRLRSLEDKVRELQSLVNSLAERI